MFSEYGLVMGFFPHIIEFMSTHSLIDGERVAKKTAFELTALASLKLAAGLLTGMTVVIADAISSFTDILGIFASYIGLHLSRRSSSKNFEYGYYRVETFAALIVSLGIIALGVLIISKGIGTFYTTASGHFRPFAVTTTVLSIFHSVRLYKRLHATAKNTNSPSLKANADDKKNDIVVGIAILIAIIADYREIPYVESVTTLLIAVFILKDGFINAKESLFYLLDYWDDPVLTRQIRRIFNQEKGLILAVKHLRLRRAGNFIFGEAFVEINPFAGIQDLREDLDLISDKIKKLNPYIKDFSIFSHISKAGRIKVGIPIESDHGMSSRIAHTLRRTNAYFFADLDDDKVRKFYIRKLGSSTKKPLNFANFLKKEKVNVLIDNNLNSLIYFNLRRIHHVMIYPQFIDTKTVKEAIRLMLIDT